jgi:hypothetical protein
MKTVKRMTRFKNIQLLEMPDNLEVWYKNVKFSDDRITVFKLHHMICINDKDKVHFYNDLRKKMSKKEKDESIVIERNISIEKDYNKLKEIFVQRNHRELVPEIIKRMCSLNENIYKEYINKLEEKYSEEEFDDIISILVEVIKQKDISDEIISLLKRDKIRDPQAFAVLSQIIGLAVTGDKIKYIYSFYRYFINNFPEENFFEGPLFGIGYYLKRTRLTTAST